MKSIASHSGSHESAGAVLTFLSAKTSAIRRLQKPSSASELSSSCSSSGFHPRYWPTRSTWPPSQHPELERVHLGSQISLPPLDGRPRRIKRPHQDDSTILVPSIGNLFRYWPTRSTDLGLQAKISNSKEFTRDPRSLYLPVDGRRRIKISPSHQDESFI